MDWKAFDLIAERVGAALEKQEFVRKPDADEEGGRAALFVGENLAYTIFYSTQNKRFELRTCAVEGEEPDGKWKVISSWLFDPQEDGAGDAESIINDFTETVEGPKRVAALQTARKKRVKSEESNADPVFMFNRFVGLFPELRGDLIDERAKYATVRPIVFTKNCILPRVAQLLQSGGDGQVQKLAELCNDLYENGDFDVRSILTMVLLNGLDEQKVKERMAPHFSEDMQKGYKAGVKMRGKTVKPEKVKKQSRVVAEALKNSQGR